MARAQLERDLIAMFSHLGWTHSSITGELFAPAASPSVSTASHDFRQCESSVWRISLAKNGRCGGAARFALPSLPMETMKTSTLWRAPEACCYSSANLKFDRCEGLS